MVKLSANRLAMIASVGGVFVIGNALLMRHLAQQRLRKSPYYIQARDTIMKHRPLLDFLGEPVAFGEADLGSDANFSTATEAYFEIPLKGSKQAGTLYLRSTRNAEDVEIENSKYYGWSLQNLEITVKDKPDHKLVIVQNYEPVRPNKNKKIDSSQTE